MSSDAFAYSSSKFFFIKPNINMPSFPLQNPNTYMNISAHLEHYNCKLCFKQHAMKAVQDYPFIKIYVKTNITNIFIQHQDVVYVFHIREAGTAQDPL